MNRNTRWALAIVGVLIVIVAGVVIGTGREETDATPTTQQRVDENSGADRSRGDAGATGSTTESGHAEHDHAGSGGAAPVPGGADGSGGAAPQNETGGAGVSGVVLSPVLIDGREPTIKVDKGQTVVLRARAERPATLHLHGYDKTLELTPGKIGRLRVRAAIDGEFEIAFHYHGSEVHIGKLRVSP